MYNDFGLMYLAKVHGLDTFATQCRTDGRRGRGLASADDELDDLVVCDCFSCHDDYLLGVYPDGLVHLQSPKVPNPEVSAADSQLGRRIT